MKDTSTVALWKKLVLLAALYIAQGLPFGFFTQALPSVMRKQGFRLGAISFTALLTLPWALKFVWAPLVDRYPRPVPTVRARRGRWIITCQVLAAIVFGLLAITNSISHVPTLFVGFAILNFISATQDIATDGLAVDMLQGSQRGYANGIQVAGYRGGLVIGGGLLLVIIERIGPRAVFVTLALLTLAFTVPLLLVREAPPVERAPQERVSLPHFLGLRGVGRVLAVVCSYKLAESLAAGVLRPFLVDRHFSLEDIGAVSGIAGSTGGLLGALLGGVLASVVDRRRALVVAGLFQSTMVFALAFAAVIELHRAQLASIFFAEAFASSLATAVLFTAMMDWCRPIVGATDYTVQASAVVIATGIATLVSGQLAERIGYAKHFLVSGAVGLASIALLVALGTVKAPTRR